MVENTGACKHRLSWTGLITFAFLENIEWVMACYICYMLVMPNSLVFDFMQSYGKFLNPAWHALCEEQSWRLCLPH